MHAAKVISILCHLISSRTINPPIYQCLGAQTLSVGAHGELHGNERDIWERAQIVNLSE